MHRVTLTTGSVVGDFPVVADHTLLLLGASIDGRSRRWDCHGFVTRRIGDSDDRGNSTEQGLAWWGVAKD